MTVLGRPFTPVRVPHGGSRVYGFRVGGLGYVTDAKMLLDRAVERLTGVEVLVLNALWFGRPHASHFNIEEAIEASRAAAGTKVMVAASATDESSLMYQAPYYTEPDRGLIDAYDNRFDVASWEPWLTYDGLASADRLVDPTLIICSEAAALPAGAHAYAKRTGAPVEELWLDGVNQFDFYDRADVVEQASDAIARHFA